MSCKKLYRPDFVTHNVHNLLHLTDCVRLFGPLDNSSAFPFENFMPQLTKQVRKSAYPLQQVIRRFTEQESVSKFSESIQSNKIKKIFEHSNGPLINECGCPQYKVLQFEHYRLNTAKFADSFVILNNNKIVEIKNFVTYQNQIAILGYTYSKAKPFFNQPTNSENFGISYIKKTQNDLQVYSIELIEQKLMVLPYENSLVCIPLAHF